MLPWGTATLDGWCASKVAPVTARAEPRPTAASPSPTPDASGARPGARPYQRQSFTQALCSDTINANPPLESQMELSQEAKAICDALDEFRLPRAIVHVEQDRFIAWNKSFQETTGYSADELQVAHLKDLIVIGEADAQFAESEQQSLPGVQFARCTTRCSGQEHFATGYCAKREDGFILLMPDVVDLTTGAIQDARVFGQQEERNRILRLFHERVSNKLLVAAFEVQRAKMELEAKGLEEERAVSKAAEKLNESIDAVVSVLDPGEPGKAGPPTRER
jgi:hypothetical protein